MADRISLPDRVTESWNRISLRTKITGVTVLLLTLGLIVAGVGSGTVLRNYLLDEVDKNLLEASQDLDGEVVRDICEPSISPTPYYLAVLGKGGESCDN